MDRIVPSEGIDAGSIPAGSTLRYAIQKFPEHVGEFRVIKQQVLFREYVPQYIWLEEH